MGNKLSYIGVKGIICDGNKILITQEPQTFVGGGKWELPGGKLSHGEESTPLQDILLREIKEELGPDIKVEIGDLVDIIRRPWNKPGCESDMVFLATYECAYRGGKITLSEENCAYRWVTADDIVGYEFIPGYLPVLQKFFEQKAKAI